ncbi:GNAT family N-acetyltransferase [Agromyces archimandritae]|uniref:GNAT family N-acetyltransferase n=1 Tax=Agromyces archimandritae TaxID=2781962 RepID=A0A975FMJ8_9MICO|nr:GNAT family N-acetyltransferase [Agromyces archimandritae]QTX04676.1 GNAT family N-acetyltransferase [Agromyces archimandritae]
MPIEIRELRDEDFFAWIPLFDVYCRCSGTSLDDQKALVVWNWLRDPAEPLTGAGAFDEQGALVGFVHSRVVPRALRASFVVTVDDLFVDEGRRRAGIGTALLEHARSRPGIAEFGWAVPAGNEAALGLAERIGRRTDLVVFASGVPEDESTAGDAEEAD